MTVADMQIDRFHPADLLALPLQDAQACVSSMAGNPDYADTLAKFESWTGRIDGRVVFCAGVIPLWPGRSQVWAVIASDIGSMGMLRLTRAVRRFLTLQQEIRIEATVVADFGAGHRWMDILGFKRETPEPMRGYLPDGRDAVLYARAR